MSNLDEITNFYAVTADLGTAGMPTRPQFSAIAQAGYRMVINLARIESPGQLPDEAELVRQMGMEYIHIPVDWDLPQVENVREFFTAMDLHIGQKIFVHCVANYRAAVFVYIYRCKRMSVSPEQAWEDLTHLWNPDGVWLDLIKQAQEQIEIDS